LKQIGPDLRSLSEAFAELLVAVTPIVAKVLELVVALVAELAPVIVPVIGAGIKVLTTILRGFAFLLTDFTIPSIKVLIALFKGDFKGAADLALQTAQNLKAKVVENFGGLVIGVRDALNRYVFELRQKALDGALQFVQGIQRMVNDAAAKVRAIPGKIRDSFGDTARVLFSAGADIIQGLINGIQSKIGALASAAANAANSVTGKIKGLLGIHSPSIVMEGVGDDTMQGFINGIVDSIPALQQAIGQVAAIIPGATSTTTAQLAGVPSLGAVQPIITVSIGNEAVDRYVTTRVEQVTNRNFRTLAQGVRR